MGTGTVSESFTGFWDPRPHTRPPWPCAVLRDKCLVLSKLHMKFYFILLSIVDLSVSYKNGGVWRLGVGIEGREGLKEEGQGEIEARM